MLQSLTFTPIDVTSEYDVRGYEVIIAHRPVEANRSDGHLIRVATTGSEFVLRRIGNEWWLQQVTRKLPYGEREVSKNLRTFSTKRAALEAI